MGHVRVMAVFYDAVDYVRWVGGELLEADARRVGVVAMEQMGFRVDPVTGKLIKGLPLMLQSSG